MRIASLSLNDLTDWLMKNVALIVNVFHLKMI